MILEKGVLERLLKKFEVAMGEHDKEEALVAWENAPQEFEDVAKTILNGHFLVEQGHRWKKVHPVCVEMYYHEEWDGGVKDPIVYHKGKEKEAFSLGVLHNHVSGIDITFEKTTEKGIVRASALIREFAVEEGGGENAEAENGMGTGEGEQRWEANVVEVRSTYLYEALFGQFSVFGGGFRISWVDGDEDELKGMRLQADVRKNVSKYVMEGSDYRKKKVSEKQADEKLTASRKYVQDMRKWQFRRI